eukprot:12324-Prymnesium_polylepis.1
MALFGSRGIVGSHACEWRRLARMALLARTTIEWRRLACTAHRADFTQDRVVLQGSSMSKGDGGYLTTYFQHSNSTIERWESRDDATTGTTQTMTPKIQLRDILLKAGIASLDERR